MKYTMVVIGYSKGSDKESKVSTTSDIEADDKQAALLEAAKVMADIKLHNPETDYEYFLRKQKDFI